MQNCAAVQFCMITLGLGMAHARAGVQFCMITLGLGMAHARAGVQFCMITLGLGMVRTGRRAVLHDHAPTKS